MTWIAAINIALLFLLAVNQLHLRRYGLAAVLIVSGVVWALSMAEMPANHIHFGEFCLHESEAEPPPQVAGALHVRFVVVDQHGFGEGLIDGDWSPWLGG